MKPALTISRLRGGSFFTMVIFVMMLISCGLMYYYFQRTRALERDLLAIRNGEIDPNDADKGFFAHMPWSKRDPDATPAVAANLPQTAPPVTSTPRSIPAPPATQKPETAVAPLVQNAEPENLKLDAVPTIESEEPDTIPFEAETTPEVDQAEATAPGPGEATAENRAPEPSETPASPAEATGDSLYNMEPPPVRVRAPQRR